MTPDQILQTALNVNTEAEFDAVVKYIEDTYREIMRDMSQDGNGAVFYAGNIRVTYHYNLGFHISVDYKDGKYRPNW